MSKFKFADQLGFSPPIVFEEVKRSGHYEGNINFKKLFAFLKLGVVNKGVTAPFDFENFVETRLVKGGSTYSPVGFGVSSPDRVVSYEVPYETKTSTGEDISLRPETTLNKCIDTINTVPDISVVADFESEKVRLIIAFAYDKDGRKKIPLRNYAIVFNTFHFEHFETILGEIGVDIAATGLITNGESVDLSENIRKAFSEAFQKAGEDRNELDWIYAAAPNYIIKERGKSQLIKDLTLILEGLVDQIGIDEERVVMRILEGLFILYLLEGEPYDFLTKETDVLLNMLIRRTVKGVTLFERMYTKMNDTGFGDDNFTKLMQFIYKLWLRSSWSKQKTYKDRVSGPQSIAYTNTRVLGFNSNKYNFDFKRLEDDIDNLLAIKVTRKQRAGGSIKDGTGGFNITSTDYHPFQPLRMSEIPENKEFVIGDTLIPAFYLKAFDDKGAWANFQKGVWLAVDILTIATGVGNILKFRYLLSLAVQGGKTIGRLAIIKIGVSALEITSGALSAMLNLTDGCAPAKAGEDKSLCQHMHEYLFILDLLSLSADAVIQSLLKKKARDILKIVDDTIDPFIIKHLSEISGSVSDYSARLAKRTSKVADKVSTKIKKFEDEIKDYGEFRRNKDGVLEKVDLEHGMILNNANKVNIKHQGRKFPNYIDWSYIDFSKFKNSILTHNHPSSSGLSLADVEVFLRLELREIRAVGKNGNIFSMKNVNINDKVRKQLIKTLEREKEFAIKTFSDAGEYFQDAYVFRQVFDRMRNNIKYINYIN